VPSITSHVVEEDNTAVEGRIALRGSPAVESLQLPTAQPTVQHASLRARCSRGRAGGYFTAGKHEVEVTAAADTFVIVFPRPDGHFDHSAECHRFG